MKRNGYRPSHRNRWLLIETGLLTLQEFCLWELYLDSMDFDKNHDSFSCIEVDHEQTATILGYSSVNSVRETKHKKLLDIGLIVETNQPNIFRVPNPERHIPPSKYPNLNGKAHEFTKQEMDQSIEFILQNFGVKAQYIEKLAQKIDVKSSNNFEYTVLKALGSSKVESNVAAPQRERSALVLEEENEQEFVYTKERWEKHRLEDPGLPSYENRRLIDEAIGESTPINDDYKYNQI